MEAEMAGAAPTALLEGGEVGEPGRGSSMEFETIPVSLEIDQEFAALVNDLLKVLRGFWEVQERQEELSPARSVFFLGGDRRHRQDRGGVSWKDLERIFGGPDRTSHVAKAGPEDALGVRRLGI
jgi:hypothetical protein